MSVKIECFCPALLSPLLVQKSAWNCVFMNPGAAVLSGSTLSCSRLGQKAMEQPRSAAESRDTAEHRAGSAHNCHRVPAAEEALGCVSSWIQFKSADAQDRLCQRLHLHLLLCFNCDLQGSSERVPAGEVSKRQHLLDPFEGRI
ncbi:hypothetical protein AV530_000665 [Patagioenas fasciata monilis]|uniref:Uncharacterized protein n=1 Tax=Patagioenas fasciata monilis TaxID=372326 RepID=A0A1V4IG11_PATFA|nr:hypothetical protein AV530_000665 [Patagioenas fasciata monilis]